MKIFNRYTYLFLGLLVIAAFVLINFIPNLETEEFDQQVIDNIIEGVTTTTEPTQNQDVDHPRPKRSDEGGASLCLHVFLFFLLSNDSLEQRFT